MERWGGELCGEVRVGKMVEMSLAPRFAEGSHSIAAAVRRGWREEWCPGWEGVGETWEVVGLGSGGRLAAAVCLLFGRSGSHLLCQRGPEGLVRYALAVLAWAQCRRRGPRVAGGAVEAGEVAAALVVCLRRWIR